MFRSLVPVTIAGLAYVLQSLAQSTTSSAASVPTGVPIDGDYSGAYRPRVHFSPPKVSETLFPPFLAADNLRCVGIYE